jgi:4a-hydroxytetrahydrobiopterin dehydratase
VPFDDSAAPGKEAPTLAERVEYATASPGNFPGSHESGTCTEFNMPKIPKLSKPEIASALRKIDGWTVANGKLHREYRFADFVHAFGFMATAALIVEKMGHHPEWSNVYDRLSVDLTTHDAGGITKKDVDLATVLETLAARFT